MDVPNVPIRFGQRNFLQSFFSFPARNAQNVYCLKAKGKKFYFISLGGSPISDYPNAIYRNWKMAKGGKRIVDFADIMLEGRDGCRPKWEVRILPCFSYNKNQKFHIKFFKIEVFLEKVSYDIFKLLLEGPKVS